MNAKGQGSIFSLFSVVIGLIVIVALLPVVGQLSYQITVMNSSGLQYFDMINLLVGSMGLIMVILFIIGVISDFQTRQQYIG